MSTVAIIGSGISGLGAAYLLHPHHDIRVYEKSPSVGGHTRTLTLKYADKTIPVDTGFIVYNERNYPHLTAMFRHLGVKTQKSCMTFGVTANGGKMEWGAQNPNALFGQRGHLFSPSFYRMLLDIVRFNLGAVRFIQKNPDATLGEMAKKMRMGEWFRRYYLFPMGGAIWSCSMSKMLDFPAFTFVEFFDKHGLLTITRQPQWYTVTGGAREYIAKLIPSFEDRITVNCGVSSVKRENDKVRITDGHGESLLYDHVVLACHADEALALLVDASDEERSALSAFRYEKNHAVLHRDPSFMPKRRRCWSSWVHHVEADGQETRNLGVTYWMNLLQSINHDYPLFVTLNPTHAIKPDAVFDEHVFEHPIFTKATVAAQAQLALLQGRLNTWHCGAHLRYGFHEDGLMSAVAVAQKLGARVPWH